MEAATPLRGLQPEPTQEVFVKYMDEEVGDIPGMERVTIRLHMPASDCKAGMKEYELLPVLLHALALATQDPRLPREQQSLFEVCRRQICDALAAGSELPPMTFAEERANPRNAILRVSVYVPKVVVEQGRRVEACKAGISLANEVARSDGS